MQEFVEGLGRMKGHRSIKFKVVIQGNISMSLLFFSEDCPEGNPDLRVRNLFDYKLEKRKEWAHRT